MSAVGQTRSERAEAQRERILNAAQKCFTEHGFHGASMAAIAETAEMSPGLIYRYFKGKGEIIQGIVERQLAWVAREISEGRLGRQGPVDALFDGYRRAAPCVAHDHWSIEPALFLEIVAESSRDPQVAATLQRFDAAMEGHIHAWLLQQAHDPDCPQLAVRTFALRCFIEGLKVRQLREPDIDPATLRGALQHALECLSKA